MTTVNAPRSDEYVNVNIIGQAGVAPSSPVAAAALGDDTANPTTQSFGSFLHGFDGTTHDRLRSGADNADGVTALALGLLKVASSGFQYNGSTLDRVRGTTDVTVFASAARTATPTPFDGTNYNGRSLHLVIDVTAVVADPSVVFTIQGKDSVSGKFYTILASAAITGTGTTVLRVGPGLTAGANLVANDILPRQWRVIATHADSDSITYSVGASVI